MMRKQMSDPRLFYGAVILVTMAMDVWFFGGAPAAAAGFYAAGAVYGILLFRVVSYSGRAAFVMRWAFTLSFMVLNGIGAGLDVPMAGPLLLGFGAGGIAGGYQWTGKRAGSALKRKRSRTEDGRYTGGWRLALINAACAVVLLALPAAYLADGVTTGTILASTLAGFLGGWCLFRFVKSVQARFMTLLCLFFAFIPALLAAARYGYWPAPAIAVFGLMAGILVGGRYWWGPRFGEPRPPFAGQGTRRRRKRKRKAGAAAPKKRTEAAGRPA